MSNTMPTEEIKLIDDLMSQVQSMAGYYSKGSHYEKVVTGFHKRITELKAKQSAPPDKRLLSIAEKISENVYGIHDYCHLKNVLTINYQALEYPLDYIEKWSAEAKEQIDQIIKILKP